MPSRLPLWKKILFSTLLGLVVLVPSFLVLETWYSSRGTWVYLDVLTSKKVQANPNALWAVEDAFSAYRGKPGANLQADEGHKSINEHGFMSTPSISVHKLPGVVRVVFLGGSSTAGPGLADDQTWPWQTIEALRRNPEIPAIDFINAALGGYTSFESIGRLWSRLRFFSPDVIVVYHGWNEFYYFETAALDNIHKWRMDSEGGWSITSDVEIPPVYEPLFIDRFLAWSNILSSIRIRFSTPIASETGRAGSASAPNVLSPTWDRRGLDVWRGNLQVMRHLADQMGARLIVVKQATLIHPDLPATDRTRCRVQLHGFDYAAHIDAFTALWKVVDEEIPVEDVADARALSGKPALFLDHIHQTPQGSAALSEIMSEVLAPVILHSANRRGVEP
ncbi:MAG: SGNH/GDSL hydrolase family protein [Pseudomonadota bacterium]